MIENEQQYEVTKVQTEKFERALEQLIAHGEERAHVHPRLREAEEVAMQSMIDRLRADLREYDAERQPQPLRHAVS